MGIPSQYQQIKDDIVIQSGPEQESPLTYNPSSVRVFSKEFDNDSDNWLQKSHFL